MIQSLLDVGEDFGLLPSKTGPAWVVAPQHLFDPGDQFRSFQNVTDRGHIHEFPHPDMGYGSIRIVVRDEIGVSGRDHVHAASEISFL